MAHLLSLNLNIAGLPRIVDMRTTRSLSTTFPPCEMLSRPEAPANKESRTMSFCRWTRARTTRTLLA
jgi:hypothetical protein